MQTHPMMQIADIEQNNLVREGVSAAAAQGIAVRAGHSTFSIFCATFARPMGFLEADFQLQPVQSRLSAGLQTVLAQLNALSGVSFEFTETLATFDVFVPFSDDAQSAFFRGFVAAYFEWASNGKTFSCQQIVNAHGQVVVSFNKKPLDV